MNPTEALAAINILRSSWPARNPPTPVRLPRLLVVLAPAADPLHCLTLFVRAADTSRSQVLRFSVMTAAAWHQPECLSGA